MGCCAWHRCSMQWRTGCSAIAEPQGPAEAPGSGGGAACQWDAPTAPLLTAAALLSAQAFYCFAPPQQPLSQVSCSSSRQKLTAILLTRPKACAGPGKCPACLSLLALHPSAPGLQRNSDTSHLSLHAGVLWEPLVPREVLQGEAPLDLQPRLLQLLLIL